MLVINEHIMLADNEIDVSAIRAQGAGGQNVNKVSSAIHLRFDIHASSLPNVVKQRLSKLQDARVSNDGVIIIKAQNHRTQEKNRREALSRLKELILTATKVTPRRIPTKPGPAAKRKRIETKKKRGDLKKLRTKPTE